MLNENSKCIVCDKDRIKKKYKIKETKVKFYFDINDIKYLSHNKELKNICKLIKDIIHKRPDFIFKCDDGHFIIVEVDEYQHCGTHYQKEETQRMIKIQKVLNTPVVFIRYNPDNFKIKGIKQYVYDEDRLKILVDVINFYMNMKKSDIFKILVDFLFYDTDVEDYSHKKAIYFKK
jgi:hypothetical protein